MNIKKLIKKTYRNIFPEVQEYLVRALKDCNSILDIGCGYDSPLKFVTASYKVGVDGFKPYLNESKKKGIHNKYILTDIRILKLEEKSFDAVVAWDIIEHLTKEDGLIMIKKMEKWAKKKVIIYTPNSFLAQKEFHKNPLQVHKSGWNADEFTKLGFMVYGMHGLKFLRGEKAEIRLKPRLVWLIASDITQKFTYHYPKAGFQLLVVKSLK